MGSRPCPGILFPERTLGRGFWRCGIVGGGARVLGEEGEALLYTAASVKERLWGIGYTGWGFEAWC